jgi:hypothetical protein
MVDDPLSELVTGNQFQTLPENNGEDHLSTRAPGSTLFSSPLVLILFLHIRNLREVVYILLEHSYHINHYHLVSDHQHSVRG